MTHNKKLVPLLNLFINCISAESAPQILPLNEEYAHLFKKNLMIGLCNSSADCLFCLTLLLTLLPEAFNQKIYKP